VRDVCWDKEKNQLTAFEQPGECMRTDHAAISIEGGAGRCLKSFRLVIAVPENWSERLWEHLQSGAKGV
jgi:hypothetical protein